jgi:hypothetical protein
MPGLGEGRREYVDGLRDQSAGLLSATHEVDGLAVRVSSCILCRLELCRVCSVGGTTASPRFDVSRKFGFMEMVRGLASM